MPLMNPFKRQEVKVPEVVKEDKKVGKPDFNIYEEKLTHTYTCPKCGLEFQFDPNDGRKFNCPAVTYEYGYSRACKAWSACCHHYEKIVPKSCSDCGEEYDPRWNDHKLHCKAQECSVCGKRAYAPDYVGNRAYSKSTGLKIVNHRGKRKCVPCYKDDVLIAVLNKLAEKL